MAEPVSAPPPSEEIVVSGQRLSEAQAAVVRRLRGEGYFRLASFGEKSFFFTAKLWKPWVMVHEQGFARVRGVPVMPLPPGPMTTLGPNGQPLPKPWEDPDSTVVTLNFLTQSPRAVRAQRERLAEQLEPLLADVRDAHWGIARAQRIVDLRDELARLWFGVASAPARREAIAAIWLHTEPDEAGALVRGVVAAFVDEEVQRSAEPFLAEEIDAVNAARTCNERFSPAAP